jgi:uroporphyrinogen-III synthase
LEETLAPAAREIVSVVGYRQIDIPRPSARTIQHLRAGKIDWVFLTSGNVARGFFSWLDSDLPQILRERTKLLSISPITSQVVREAGYSVALEASKHSPEGMMDELLASMAVGSKIRR